MKKQLGWKPRRCPWCQQLTEPTNQIFWTTYKSTVLREIAYKCCGYIWFVDKYTGLTLYAKKEFLVDDDPKKSYFETINNSGG